MLRHDSDVTGNKANEVREKQELFNLKGKQVILENCDFSKENLIKGDFVYGGIRYKGVVINVSIKMMKTYKNKAKIPVRVIGKSEQ